MYKQILILLMYVVVSSGSVSWKIVNKPTRFGEDLELQCNTDESTSLLKIRQWSKGQFSTILVMNGISTDPMKYSEVFDRTKRISVLKISAFDNNDLFVEYTCQLGFLWDKHWLNISIEDFGNSSVTDESFVDETRVWDQRTPHNSEKDQTAGTIGHIVFSLVYFWYIMLIPLIAVIYRYKDRLCQLFRDVVNMW